MSKTIHVEMELLDKANKKAKKEDRTLNSVIESALREYLKEVKE